MKACVCTYCTWESLGSVLQSVGLKRTLSELDIKSVIPMERPMPVFLNKPVLGGSVSRTVVRLHDRAISKKRKTAFERANAFISCNLDVVYYPESKEIFSGEELFDLYLAGSDQIWNPDILNPVFFLDFVPKNGIKVSYAASMGKTEIHAGTDSIIKGYLSSFREISVREEACKIALRDLTNKEIKVHIDPVFLRSSKEWREFEAPYDIRTPYILLYTIYWDAHLNEKVRALHKRTGLPVMVLSGHLNRCFGNRRIYDAGPAEFLWLIDHADYVITSSFHAAAFSLIFQKRVSAICNPASPSRLQNLFEKLEAPFIEIDRLDDPNVVVDRQRIQNRVMEEKCSAMEYLRKVTKRI